jgi:hypothetical protein
MFWSWGNCQKDMETIPWIDRGGDVESCSCEHSGGCDSCGSWEVECRLRLVEAVD